MSNALEKLLRLRAHHRREATLALHEAERAFEEQKEKVDGLRESVVRERAAIDPNDGEALAGWAAWRIQAEMGARREGARLAQRGRDVEVKVGQHRKTVQDELSLESVLEARAEAEAAEERRAEAREMDEIAARRHR